MNAKMAAKIVFSGKWGILFKITPYFSKSWYFYFTYLGFGLVVVGAQAPLVAGTGWAGVSNCRPPLVVTAATEATAEATAAAFFIFCFSRNRRIISPLRCEGGACGSFPALVRLRFGRVVWAGEGCCAPALGGTGGFCKGGCCCICCWWAAAMAIVRYIWL